MPTNERFKEMTRITIEIMCPLHAYPQKVQDEVHARIAFACNLPTDGEQPPATIGILVCDEMTEDERVLVQGVPIHEDELDTTMFVMVYCQPDHESSSSISRNQFGALYHAI